MRKKLLLCCFTLAAAACSEQPPREPSAAEQSKLGAELAGYVQSGPPVSCVQMRDLRGNRSAGEGAIVFDGPTNAQRWVNHPPGGCPVIDAGRAMVTRTTQTQLCRGDIAEVVDTVSHTTYGSCGLGDFTPYRRAKR